MTNAWVRPAVLGGFDGLVCLIGAALPALGHPAAAFHESLGVGVAEAVGMGCSEWLSDSANGRAASAIVGASTGCGAILPGLSFAVLPGAWARAGALLAVLVLTAVIGQLRAPERGAVRAHAESFGVLAAVSAVVVACTWLVGGGS